MVWVPLDSFWVPLRERKNRRKKRGELINIFDIIITL